jgi:hypothetical protein
MLGIATQKLTPPPGSEICLLSSLRLQQLRTPAIATSFTPGLRFSPKGVFMTNSDLAQNLSNPEPSAAPQQPVLSEARLHANRENAKAPPARAQSKAKSTRLSTAPATASWPRSSICPKKKWLPSRNSQKNTSRH